MFFIIYWCGPNWLARLNRNWWIRTSSGSGQLEQQRPRLKALTISVVGHTGKKSLQWVNRVWHPSQLWMIQIWAIICFSNSRRTQTEWVLVPATQFSSSFEWLGFQRKLKCRLQPACTLTVSCIKQIEGFRKVSFSQPGEISFPDQIVYREGIARKQWSIRRQ